MILRPLCGDDGEVIARATDETWEDLAQWMRWAVDRKKLTDPLNCKIYAERCRRSFQEKKDFTFGGFLKETNDFVLISRLAPIVAASGIYEFCGYWCRKKYQNQGFMKEAINAVARYAFDVFQAKSLKITHATGNFKTRAVMDDVGFVEQEILKLAHSLPNGLTVDEHVLIMHDCAQLPALDVSWNE
jgi:RimJ/RimL family protein N-acetyltransferase